GGGGSIRGVAGVAARDSGTAGAIAIPGEWHCDPRRGDPVRHRWGGHGRGFAESDRVGLETQPPKRRSLLRARALIRSLDRQSGLALAVLHHVLRQEERFRGENRRGAPSTLQRRPPGVRWLGGSGTATRPSAPAFSLQGSARPACSWR